MTSSSWVRESVDMTIGDVEVSIDTLVVPGPDPVVFLHGFGSTKEDYADFVRFPGLAGRGFVAYDAPGFGRSRASDSSRITIDLLVDLAEALTSRLGLERFDLVGHSMGGLTGLLLAERAPDRVRSFVDIEGNVAPEDCFLSRQILTHDDDSADEFLRRFADRAFDADESSSALYASRVLSTVDPDVVRPVFESMVDLSDHGDLLSRMTGLSMPRTFMHGAQNAHLSYLPALAESGVAVVQIPHSGHWPMYANPVAMWEAIAAGTS